MTQKSESPNTVSGSDPARPLEGRVAIITGGGGGIGKAACKALAGRGAQIVAVDFSRERLAETASELAEEALDPALITLTGDIRREEDVENIVRETIKRLGHIDILVTAAGILRAPGTRASFLVDMSLAEWEQVIDTNLRGVFLMNRAVLPAMIRQGKGDIINISSTSGRQGFAYDSAYCASKFGVIAFSEALADEVQSRGVRVQVILPSAVDTPMWIQNAPLFQPPKILSPERVADLILYLVALPDDAALSGPAIVPLKKQNRTGEKNK